MAVISVNIDGRLHLKQYAVKHPIVDTITYQLDLYNSSTIKRSERLHQHM